VGEGKEVWGVGKIANSILPNRTEAGETDRPAGMEARRRPWPRRRSGGWGKTKGGDEGVLPRSYLGLGCAGGVDRWSAVGCKRRWPGTALAAAMESSGEEEMVVEVRGATGSRAGPLYRREKAVRGGKYPPRRPAAEGPRQGQFGKIPGVAGEVPFGIRGVELWDMTRRAGGWAMAATVAVWRGQRLRGWW
jgi:hypothetical protein